MNEIIEELRDMTSEIGNDFNDLCRTISGESDVEWSQQRFYIIKKRCKWITVIIFFVCFSLLFLKFYII